MDKKTDSIPVEFWIPGFPAYRLAMWQGMYVVVMIMMMTVMTATMMTMVVY